MANRIRLKRRVSGNAGAPSTLLNGEVAVNEVDDVIWYGKGVGQDGNATSVIAIAGPGYTMTLSGATAQSVSRETTFTGTVTFSGTTSLGAATATSPSANDDSTRVATTAWVQDIVASLGSGSVTSVALSLPNIFTVSGSPVTSSGTLTAALATQAANKIFAGPTTGADSAPTFRSLAASDIPDLSSVYLPLSGGTISTLTISGNLLVSGTTTTIDSTSLSIADKAIELAKVASPTDTTADGAGIIVLGSSNHTWLWVNATDAWTSTEHIDLASGKSYYINGTSVLSASTLGSGVTSSSLTSVGTLTSGAIGAGFTTVAVAQGGTGAATLTGILKGNGTSAFTAAVDGTDYLSPTSDVDGGSY